jgi:hypothetical protein
MSQHVLQVCAGASMDVAPRALWAFASRSTTTGETEEFKQHERKQSSARICLGGRCLYPRATLRGIATAPGKMIGVSRALALRLFELGIVRAVITRSWPVHGTRRRQL